MQEWTHELPLREQGAIAVGLRGCDLAPKLPLDSTERQLTGFLRYLTMVPADPRELGTLGGFFQPFPPKPGWKQTELEHYPLHWVSHLMHAYEVVGYRHPDLTLGDSAFVIYVRLVEALHLNIESKEQMIERLSEDRIASGTVVS